MEKSWESHGKYDVKSVGTLTQFNLYKKCIAELQV